MTVDELIGNFESGDWKAGVVGLGYVGLPLSMTLANAGIDCFGFDVAADVVASLLGGVSHVDDVSQQELDKALANGFGPTTDTAVLAEADAIFVCVPSPLGRNRQPDTSHIKAAAVTVASVLRPQQLISLESTSYPGTTEEILLPDLVETGLRLDEDIFVAFSPERVDPGRVASIDSIPKVVGGVTETSGLVAEAAYGRFVSSVHRVSSARAAEMAKLLENTYRAVNIGLINEMAQLTNQLDIDIWEVIEAAATKPFGFQAFYPGPGVGGHCIPFDPQFLAWRAKEARFATRFIDLAEQLNSSMPTYTAARVADLLNERGLPIFGTKLLGLGLTYKANVSDSRESPAIDVLDELARRGAIISVLDPLLDPQTIRSHGYEPVTNTEGELGEFAIAVVLTDHDAIDLADIATKIQLVFDARGAFKRRGIEAPNVVSL